MNDVIDTERQVARAILITPQHEVLMLRLQPPDGGLHWWVAPGGGLEAGENFETGLRRELLEELSLTDFVLGPLIWKRRHTYSWEGRRLCQNENFYVVHTDRFNPVMTDEGEAKIIDRLQWWPLADIAASEERFTPLSLHAIVTRYLAEGAPLGELSVEVLID